MPSTRQHAAARSPQTGEAAPRELPRLSAQNSATLTELRQFLGHMRGKNPQQGLGLVAESGLTRGILLSTLACGVLLVVFTVGPYLLSGGPATQSPQQTAQQPAASDAQEPAEPPSDPASPVTPPLPASADAQQTADKLGIGQTRGTTEDEVPDSLEQLLDGIK